MRTVGFRVIQGLLPSIMENKMEGTWKIKWKLGLYGVIAPNNVESHGEEMNMKWKLGLCRG